MKFHDEQQETIEFKIPPPKLDPYKRLDEFFESSAKGVNRDVLLEYMDVLVTVMHHGQEHDFYSRRSPDRFAD